MSRVSIVIPAYNQGRYLWQAASSAAAQSHDDVDVIVVDDGSTDDTDAVCSRLAEMRRVRVVRQENLGAGAARNRGARESTGDYLCFLDADDFYHPDKVARQVAQLERHRELGFVYCDIVAVDAEGQPLADQSSVGESRDVVHGDILDSLVLGRYFPPMAVMVRRKTFESLRGFDEALDGHADLDLWLRLAARGHRTEYLHEKLAYYRSHPGMSCRISEMHSATAVVLAKLTRLFPSRTAQVILRLRLINEDLRRENRVLNEALESAVPT